MRPVRPLGLRATTTFVFALLALVVSVSLAIGTYLTARYYLIDQRELTASRQSFADASVVRDGLLTTGAQVSSVLDTASPPPGSVLLIRRDGNFYSSSLKQAPDIIPADLRALVDGGQAGLAWGRLNSDPVVMVGVPIPAVDAQFFEVAPTVELDSTLRTLAIVLGIFTLLTTAGGAVIGRAASARVVAPLNDVAGAAARIATGEMATRLAPTSDPDLAVIVGSFNTMVEALDERISRDARFAADVSHELRSPVTTLMASVEMLSANSADLPDRAATTVGLLASEVGRLHRSLEHLLELARLDAGVALRDTVVVDIRELVEFALEQGHRTVDVDGPAYGTALVRVDKLVLNRVLVNLFDNADLHGGGLTAVRIVTTDATVEVSVEDRGPGVPDEEKARVFDRFVRSGARGSRPGSGLGLSLVAETMTALGGAVWCDDTPGGGATFVITLPLVSEEGGAV